MAGLPVVVDLPESTWPITTTLMCVFSLLWKKTFVNKYSTNCDRGGMRNDEMVKKEKSTYPMVAV